jgi:hypothetical protein
MISSPRKVVTNNTIFRWMMYSTKKIKNVEELIEKQTRVVLKHFST